MPLYGYKCHSCELVFESLVRASDEFQPSCPHCKSMQTEKLITVFGAYNISGNNSASTKPKSVVSRAPRK